MNIYNSGEGVILTPKNSIDYVSSKSIKKCGAEK
jgi:hypothetical protein